jgi:hypothetical protein
MRLLKEEDGQTLVLVAAFMGLVMFGFLAIAVDVGSLFHARRMAQSAADAAALAAAEEEAYGNSGNESAVADGMAQLNGFDTTLATNPATVTIGTPTAGNYSGSTAYIQAVVSKPISTFFLSAFNGNRTVTVAARAVAGGGQDSPTCICLESPTGAGLTMSNGSKISAPHCGATVDSSGSNAVGLIGGANLSALSLGTVSNTWDDSSNINNGGSIASSTKVVQKIPTTCGPTMPAAPTYNSSQCSADPITLQTGGGTRYTVGPGSSYGTTQTGNVICYNSLTVNGNGDTVTLNPGTYVINGGYLTFDNGTNGGGTGVTFYLTGSASMVIQNGANAQLSAPTSGTYSGILVYQAASDTAALSIQGGSTVSLSGNIYAPGAALTLGNGSGTTVNAAVVAQSLTMNGGGTLASTAGQNLGTLNISVSKLVE